MLLITMLSGCGEKKESKEDPKLLLGFSQLGSESAWRIGNTRDIEMKAAEYGAIPSCDILSVFGEYRQPRHAEFTPRTHWSLLNAFTEVAHKYPPSRHDQCHRRLTRLFGLDGHPALLAR